MRELNPRFLGVIQARFRYANRPCCWHRHEESNLDYQLRTLASHPLDDDGICRDQESNLDLWFRTPLCSFHYTITAWHPDQESNLDPTGRSRVHCPLCYRSKTWHLRQDLNLHWPGRNRPSCPLNDGGVEHHQGVEPCRYGLQPDLLSQSCGAWQGTEESNLAANRGWNPVRFTERAPHGALAGNRTRISAVPRQRPRQMDLEGGWWTGR